MSLTRVSAGLAVLTALAFVVPAVGSASADDDPSLPVVIAVDRNAVTYSGEPTDLVHVDWKGIPPAERNFEMGLLATDVDGNPGDAVVATAHDHAGIQQSYRAGKCSVCTAGARQWVWGPWYHPSIPASVNAAPPTLKVTQSTPGHPGLTLTVVPGAHTGAAAFWIFEGSSAQVRLIPPNLTISGMGSRPNNVSFSVQACYSDCAEGYEIFDDGFVHSSARSAPTTPTWVANTPLCKTVGLALYNLGWNWRPACNG